MERENLLSLSPAPTLDPYETPGGQINLPAKVNGAEDKSESQAFIAVKVVVHGGRGNRLAPGDGINRPSQLHINRSTHVKKVGAAAR